MNSLEFPTVRCLPKIKQVLPTLVPLLQPFMTRQRDLPQGVTFVRAENRFCAIGQDGYGHQGMFGYSKTVRDAHDAYLNRRASVVLGHAQRLYKIGAISNSEKLELVKVSRFLSTYPRTSSKQKIVEAVKPQYLIHNVGINDTPYSKVYAREYDIWRQMLSRCYDPRVLKKQPTYVGCSVAPVWLKFSAFLKWYQKNYVEGYHLDKDILETGNKVYGPKTCCLIPQEINKLFTARGACRGATAQGVSRGRSSKFEARYKRYSSLFYVGAFDTEAAAHRAYQESKRDYIFELASTYLKAGKISERVAKALRRRAKNFEF